MLHFISNAILPVGPRQSAMMASVVFVPRVQDRREGLFFLGSLTHEAKHFYRRSFHRCL